MRTVVKRDERGASAVEYGLMVAAVAAVILVAVFAFGGVVKGAFDRTSSCIELQAQSPC